MATYHRKGRSVASSWGDALRAADLFSPAGLPATDLTVRQAIRLLEAAVHTPGASVETLELTDYEGYLTELAEPAELADFEYPDGAARILQRVRFGDGSDHVLTLEPHGITARPLDADPRSSASQASLRVQEEYEALGLKRRPTSIEPGEDRRVYLLIVLGIAFPFLMLIGDRDSSVIGRAILTSALVVAGLSILPWIHRALARRPPPRHAPGHWLVDDPDPHPAPSPAPIPILAIYGVAALYLTVSMAATLLAVGWG